MIIDTISDFLYTYLLVFLLTAAGIFFSVKTGFIQLRFLPDAIRLVGTKSENGKELTPFHTLMISTASRVGIGNIAGVSTAIVLGGAGSVFWMWLLAILGGASSFIESTLGQMYKVKDPEQGMFRGGPSYYIRQGLGNKKMGVLFAVFLILTCGYGANALQAYNIMDALRYYTEAPWMPVTVGMILAVLTTAAVAGGGHLIGRISATVVPVMAAIYILMTLVVIGSNLSAVPVMLKSIFAEAFDLHAFSGGLSGSCIVYGIKRGLFSNEAGMGSAPNATSSATVSHPVEQGLVSVVSVFIDTLVICTATAFMLLLSGAEETGLAGVPFVQQAMATRFGEWGIHMLTLSIFLFAFTSIIGNYFYAENGLRFITDHPVPLVLFRGSVVLMVFYGTQMDFTIAWGMADIFMGCMAIMNLIAIFLLRKPAFRCMEDYLRQRREGEIHGFRGADIGISDLECW